MSTLNISELDELKLIYYEIIDGYSLDLESRLFIKHFSDKDNHLILQKRIELFKYYSSEGVPHESQLLKTAIENEEWSQAKEDRILELKYEISDNERNLPNMIWQQRPIIEKVIKERRDQLAEMLFERKHTLGRNIEDLIDEDVNDYVIYLSFYKDESLNTHVEDTYEKFQEWEPSKIHELNKYLADQYAKFSENNVKAIAVMPMFLNKLRYANENLFVFLNKPLNQLTHHQSYLFSLGIRNLDILSNTKGSPPDLNLDIKISEVVSWYDLQYSLNIGKKNQKEV